nr:hypothetical protein [Tanacetum cinerariifolium]
SPAATTTAAAGKLFRQAFSGEPKMVLVFRSIRSHKPPSPTRPNHPQPHTSSHTTTPPPPPFVTHHTLVTTTTTDGTPHRPPTPPPSLPHLYRRHHHGSSNKGPFGLFYCHTAEKGVFVGGYGLLFTGGRFPFGSGQQQ